MKKYLFASAILALGLALARLTAAPIDADPNQKYEITPAAGQWMICAASYQGPDAPDIAHRLVLDIRRAYNLPAYVFDHGAEEKRKQQERIQQIRALCPEGRVRIERIEEQFAVLVGGYKDMDSARKALDGFKKLKPIDDRAMDTVTWQEEAVQNGQKGIMTKTAKIPPFIRSFVVHNPTVPMEVDHSPDPHLKKWNADETYSIYHCKKPWTLAVAVFQSPTMIQSQTSCSLFNRPTDNSDGKSITTGAMNAHNLAESLRKDHFEAYVFHTQNNSVVTIGGFDRKDDPQLVQLATHQRFNVAGPPVDPHTPSVFLSNPLPMEVPH